MQCIYLNFDHNINSESPSKRRSIEENNYQIPKLEKSKNTGKSKISVILKNEDKINENPKIVELPDTEKPAASASPPLVPLAVAPSTSN